MGILRRCYRYCRNILLGLITAVVLVAVVAVIAVNRLQDMQSQVIDLLQQATGRNVTVQSLRGSWMGLNPQLVATGVEVKPGPSDNPNPAKPLLLNRLQVELALPDLLLGRLVPKVLKINAPVLHLHTDENNNLVINEMVFGSTEAGQDYAQLANLAGMRLVIEDARLIWHDQNGQTFPVGANLNMETRNGNTQITGQLQAASGQASWQLSIRGLASGKPQANCSVRIQRINWQDLPMQLRILLPRLLQGRFNSNLKCLWAQGNLQQITGRAVLEDLVLTLNPGKVTLSTLRSTVQWNRGPDSWGMQLRDIELRQANRGLAITLMTVRQAPENEYLIELPAAPLSKAFQLWQRAFTAKQPGLSVLTAVKGQVAALQARLQPSAQGLSVTDLQANCLKCSFTLQKPERSSPVFSGNLRWSPAGGSATLKTTAGNIIWPELWNTPIIMTSGQANATWQATSSGWSVALEKIRLQTPGLEIAGSASVQLDQKFQPGKLRVLVQRGRGDIGAIRTLLPNNLPVKTRQWFDNALLGGQFRIDQGTIEGDLQAGNILDQGTVTLGATVEAGNLRLVPKWPVFKAVTGRLDIQNRRLRFAIDSAIFSQQQLARIEGSLSELGTKNLLALTGQASGEIAELLTFMQTQNLDRGATGTFMKSANGIGALELTLEYPLGARKEGKFSGVYHFENQSLTLLSGLQLSDIQGKLIFDNAHIAATGLTASAFSGPMTADLFFTFKPGIREIKASGEADVPALLQFAGEKFTGLGSGQLQWQGSWQNSDDTNTFLLQSTLKGVDIKLPLPLKKDPITEWPLTVKILQQQSGLEVAVDAGKALQANLQFAEKNKQARLQSANIAIGTDLGEEPKKHGLQVNVITDDINWDAWQSTLDRFKNPKSPALPILGISLRARNMYAMSRPWGAVDLSLLPGPPQTIALKITGDRLQGSGTYRTTSDRSFLNLDMKFFYWPTAKPTQASSSSDPDTWPDLNLRVGDFRYGDMQLGQLNLLSESQPGLLKINSLQLLRNDLMMQVDGYWKSGQKRGNTVFNFQAGSIDLGSVIDSLGFEKQLQSGVADLQGQLQWPGRPADYKISRVNGHLVFHSREGKILGVKPGSGRFLGLLNADALLQRLQLDFSDLSGEGLSYNEMEAKATLSSGNLLIDKLLIFSTVALVDMRGRIGLGTEDYDLKMTVAPQLGGNVSLISALLNPVAGVAIFLLNKVFRDQINQWLRYEYMISGAWKEPQIKRIVLQANQKEPDEFRGTR